jgi:signal transduction histidine kinase
LRNPLSLIISARDMLEYDIGEQPEESVVPKYLDIIMQSTERMNNLIEDLLQAETSSQRQIEAEKLVKKVVGRVRPLADRCGFRVVPDYGTTLSSHVDAPRKMI